MKSRKLIWLFLLPAGTVIACVVVYPFIYNFYISATNMSLYHIRDYTFQGFANYGELLTEPDLYYYFFKTMIWTFANLFFHLVIGISVAMLLNRQLRGRSIFRALLILPWAMPQYISALTWKGMFNYRYGSINLILQKLNIPPIEWFSNEIWAFIAPILTNIWLGFPFIMVVTLGGLQSIPRDLYEAADIDGASGWQKFFNVTLPMLKPVLAPALVLGTIWTFNNLNVIWLVTEGGLPADKSHILVTYVYKAAFTYYRYGYAAAFSVFIFIILLVIVLIYLRQTKTLEKAY
ncbi:MAG: ABC transporter permease subunit [Candidatus Latescibacteria bacterium]|nr:ABC transporter permease subunit [bacterium]MBD3423737.1 ABC transporter permease subunit [Candidatus Latescibacterota bacterium]